MSVLKVKDPVTGEWKPVAGGGSGDPGTMTVTIDEDGKASHTSEEIYAHVQSDGTAVLDDGVCCHTLVGYCEDYATFMCRSDDNFFYQYSIYKDGSFDYNDLDLSLKWEDLQYDIAYMISEQSILTRQLQAEVGQTIVVKSVDANGTPTAWECVDLPSNEIIFARFYSYDPERLYCSTHTAKQLYNYIRYDEMAVIAFVYDENRDKYATLNCWAYAGQICVGEFFNDNGWHHDMYGNQSNFVDGLQDDSTVGKQLWCEV